MNRKLKFQELRHMPWFRFYCLGICVILLLTGIKLPSAYYQRKFGREDFECERGEERGFNFYIDEKISKEKGLFLACPNLALDKGNYHVTVSYGAQEAGSYFTLDTKVHPEALKEAGRYNLPAVGIWGTMEFDLNLDRYTEGMNFNVYYGGSGNLRIYDITVDGLDWRPGDVLAAGFFLLAFYILAGFVFVRMGKEKFRIFAALSLAAAVSSFPYFSSGLWEGDDIIFHLVRILGIRDGLLGGQFPVRVYPGAFYGAGYDCSLYYPDFFLYLPGILCLLGVSITASVQIFGILLHFLAVFLMYYSIKKIGGSARSGMLAAMVYASCEYFSCNFYLRTDLGESIAMCFFPLVICGFYTAVIKEEEKDWKALCLGMSGLILSHLMSALFAVLLLCLFCLVFLKKLLKREAFFSCVKAAAASFGLCCWFLVPFFRVFQDRKSTNIVNLIVDTQNHVLEFYEMFVSLDKEAPRTLGISLALGIIFCLYCLFFCREGMEKKTKKKILALLLPGIGIALCSTALFPWEAMMRSSFFHDAAGLVQFPWRLLGPASAFLSMAVGLAGEQAKKMELGKGMPVLFFLIFIVSLLNVWGCKNENYLYHGEAVLTTAAPYDYLFRFTDTEKLQDALPEIPEGGIELLSYEENYGNVKMEIAADAGSYVDTTLLFFTGHKAFDGAGAELPCVFGENNRMRIQFPEDYTGEVTVRFTGLPLWRFFDFVSLANVLGWILFFVYSRVKKPLSKEKEARKNGR